MKFESIKIKIRLHLTFELKKFDFCFKKLSIFETWSNLVSLPVCRCTCGIFVVIVQMNLLLTFGEASRAKIRLSSQGDKLLQELLELSVSNTDEEPEVTCVARRGSFR